MKVFDIDLEFTKTKIEIQINTGKYFRYSDGKIAKNVYYHIYPENAD